MKRILAFFRRAAIILSRVLLVLYWLLLVLSIISAITMTIPHFAVHLRLLQLAGGAYLGILTPQAAVAYLISFVLTNLWWVLLLALPFVLLRRSRPFLGVMISALGFAVLLMVPPKIIAWQTAAMLTDAIVPVAPHPAGPVTSATINADGCDDLCQRLLLGGTITTVRIAEPRAPRPREDPLPHLMFQRAPADLCRTYDPQFPPDAPCILPFPDDGKPSDVILDSTTDGSLSIDRDQAGFTPQRTFRQITTLRQRATDTTLAVHTHVRWLEPHGWVPLYANTGFDGGGLSGGGLVPAQTTRDDGARFKSATLFEQVGIALGAPRGEIVVDENARKVSLRGYLEPASYDIAFLRALLAADGMRSDTAERFVDRWFWRFVPFDTTPNAQEIELLNLFLDTLRPVPREFAPLVRSRPEYVSGGIEGLYRLYENASGTLNLSREVTGAIRRATLSQSPEENAPQEALFLKAIDGDILRAGGLIAVAGRFTFNPVPVLQRYLDRSSQTSLGPVRHVIVAACLADGRWAQALAPLISEIALNPPGERTPPPRDIDREVGRALDALNIQGQRAAWDALKAALGPERTETLRFADWGETRICR